ncbi:U3 small nucleolar RNA-associated protein 6-domain-containing protein, partial [Phlyctochytrium arcticum]
MSADSVQFHLEKMVPELEDLQERGIFTTTEIKSIVKQRTAHEYRVHRIIPLKSDFLRYIAFEQNLERLRRKRRKRMGLQEDNETHEKKKQQNAENGQEGVVNVTGVSDYSIMRRIHGLYAKMLKKFSGDVDLWIQYLNWSISVNSSKALSMQFAKAIQLHPTKPVFWIMAAKWEFEKNNNVAAGRVLMQRGIRINPESQKLWAEYFKLELLWIERIKERRKVLFKDD